MGRTSRAVMAAPEAEAHTGEEIAQNRISPRISLDGCVDSFSLSFSPDNVMLAASAGDGAVRVFHTGSGKLLYTLGGDFTKDPSILRPALPATAVKFRPNTSFSKTITCCSLQTARARSSIGTPHRRRSSIPSQRKAIRCLQLIIILKEPLSYRQAVTLRCASTMRQPRH